MSTKFRIQRYLMYTISLILILISLLITLNMYKTIEYAIGSAPYVIDDNVVEIYAPIINSLFFQLEDEQVVETTAYYFTHDDYEKIQSMDNVKYVAPRGDYMFGTIAEEYEVNKQINLANLDYDKYNMEEYASSNIGLVKESTCVEPQRINEHGKSNCSGRTDILYGSYPEDNTNQILIDPYIAMYYAEQQNIDELKDVIGKEIIAPIHYTNGITEEEKEKNITFRISGVTDINTQNNIILTETSDTNEVQEENIHFTLAFQEGSFADAANHPWTGIDYTLDDNMNAEETVKDQIQYAYKSVGLEVPSMDEIPPIKDNAYPGFYIELNSAEDVPAFTDAIKEYDPYIYINSNYTNQNTNNLELAKVFCKIE